MKITMLIALCLISVSLPEAHAQKVLAGREIYRITQNAVVQIYSGSKFSGNGFLISADGLVVTANHVISTRESGFKQYASDIKVFTAGRREPYAAIPVVPEISSDQVNYDSAILKIDASNLPHVSLGKWQDVEAGDEVTIVTTFPGIGAMLLQGSVSSRATFQTVLGPKPVDTILFEAPIRKGFSGSPIFGPSGNVIGIVDTLVFGISPALDSLRSKWSETQKIGTVKMFGIDVPASFVEIINNLDQNLISGHGQRREHRIC